MELNQIIHGDSYEIVPTLPDKSFDAVILDPNYGMGVDWWDVPLDVAFFTEHVKRVGREFYAVFGQMPYIREWDREAVKAGFYFLEHISWVKRNLTMNKRLSKGHEECYVYAIGKRRQFYQTKGRYEDVKLPGVLLDIVSVGAIDRYIKDLWVKIDRGSSVPRSSMRGHPAFKRFADNSDRSPRKANYSNVWSFLPPTQSKRTGNPVHATTKPLFLIQRLVEMLTGEGGSVTDWGSGYGTTALACQRLDRPYLCIEKVEEFHRASVERLKNDVWQPELPLSDKKT